MIVNTLIRGLGSITSFLPHWKVRVPLLTAPELKMSVYLDDELRYAANIYETEVVDVFTKVAADADVVVDIGAHYGYFSLLAANAGATVEAFEMHPENAERLRENRDINGASSINVHEAAIWDEVGQATIVEDESSTHTVNRSGHGCSVSATTLDHVDNKYTDGQIDLVKVDVEGEAAAVIEGASDVIESGKATWIIEIHDEHELSAVQVSFNEGYSVQWIDDTHLLAIPNGLDTQRPF